MAGRRGVFWSGLLVGLRRGRGVVLDGSLRILGRRLGWLRGGR